MRFDVGSAASGAMVGAQVGSAFPVVGTGLGALIGGGLGLIGSGKKRQKKKKLSTLDKQQQGIYNDYVSSLRGQGPMSDMFNFNAEQAGNVFDQTVGRPAYRNFQENIIPKITGQFRQGNLMNSSYAGQSLSRAGRDVQEGLDAQRSQYIYQGQQQQQANKQNAMENLLKMQTFAYQKPQEQAGSPVDQIMNTMAPKAAEWFADYLKSRTSSTIAPGQAG